MPLPYRLSFRVCSSSLVGRYAWPWITDVPLHVRSRSEQTLAGGRRRRKEIKREREQKGLVGGQRKEATKRGWLWVVRAAK